MSSLNPTLAVGGPSRAPREGSSLTGILLILLPASLVMGVPPQQARLFAAGRRRALGLIFGLLVAMMLTGMPISIALGLTVLTFLFTLTEVPIEAVALKLFTGIEKFEIMAIPFFILAGNFLTHGGVARRMIAFATRWSAIGMAASVSPAFSPALSSPRSPAPRPATVVAIGSIILPAMVQAGLPQALRRRRHHDLGRARHPDSAVDRDGDLRGRDSGMIAQAQRREVDSASVGGSSWPASCRV